MRSGKRPGRRKLSAGTVFMLVLLAAVLGGSALVLGRLSSGATVDLSKLNMSVLDIREDPSREAADSNDEETPSVKTQTSPKKNESVPTETAAAKNEEKGFTLTVGGSIALSGEVRKNSRSTDAKVADYADVMMLLAPQIHSDVNAVFVENIFSDKHKASDIVAPTQAVMLLQEAGFDTAACGFSQAYASGKDGTEATLMALDSKGITALGIRYADVSGNPDIRTVNGVRTAFLQYTATVPSKTRKAMEKDGTGGMIPEAELSVITQEIGLARERGAEAVIVLISWGKNGSSAPDKTQRELAAGIAEAGADLIIGCGSHMPQTAEYLSGRDGRSVLCVWSLGTLLSGDRGNVKHIAGYLLHVTVQRDGQGGVLIRDPAYTPVYTWKYKQDSRFYYRCIASDGEAPDGMDKEQRKMMEKAAETITALLKDAPLSEREQTDGP